MPQVTYYPSSYTLGTNGSNFTNPTYAYADDTSYVTVTSTAKNTTSQIYYESFNMSIPTGATINSVTIYAAGMWSTTASIQSASIQAYNSNTAMGTAGTLSTEPATMTEWSTSATGTWDSSTLNANGSTGFRILLSNIRGNSTTACTCSYDYVKVVVDYTVPTNQYDETGKPATILTNITSAYAATADDTGKSLNLLAVVTESDGKAYLESSGQIVNATTGGPLGPYPHEWSTSPFEWVSADATWGSEFIYVADITPINETGRSTIIAATAGSSHTLTIGETGRTQTALTVTTATSSQTFAETQKVAVVNATNSRLIDSVTRGETGRTQTITTVIVGTDSASAVIIERPELIIACKSAATSAQTLLESQKTMIISAQQGSTAGVTMNQTGKTVIVLLVQSAQNTQTSVETGKSSVQIVTIGEMDSQGWIESRGIVILAVVGTVLSVEEIGIQISKAVTGGSYKLPTWVSSDLTWATADQTWEYEYDSNVVDFVLYREIRQAIILALQSKDELVTLSETERLKLIVARIRKSEFFNTPVKLTVDNAMKLRVLNEIIEGQTFSVDTDGVLRLNELIEDAGFGFDSAGALTVDLLEEEAV